MVYGITTEHSLMVVHGTLVHQEICNHMMVEFTTVMDSSHMMDKMDIEVTSTHTEQVLKD